ncbi:ABC transporter permease [Pseudomonas typographi]|uniref:ABC transporter permease n=1 Tax=Pseudomonas typographi TaxID=2715964 RepID=A0ABR7Z1U8_9PSED|nr:ABC transporter permease [Pseudomonas typographi]MBD1587442.1 ABC transporter permease [Pseudomonas typographi]MBD1599476.1 ABC transporter permease [Pseudomonas typographi]
MNRIKSIMRARSMLLGLIILALICVAALSANLIYPADPFDIVARANLWPGSPGYPLGTDMLGRDMTSGMLHAARISLIVGVGAAGLSVALGTLIGVVSGYFGGWVDDCLMRLTELFQTMPSFLFAILLVVILQPSIGSIVFAIGITSWPQISRLVRAEAMRVRQQDFVSAALTMGIQHPAIIWRHILPNSLAPVIVAASILIAQAILTEASLSFLGLGDPSVISWGSMVGAGRSSLRTAWYMTAVPGAAIFLAVMGFMYLGNGLNDLLNPRTEVR